MKSPLRKTHPILKMVNTSLIDLPAPSSINNWWNFGSLLSFCLLTQTITGIFLSMHYCSDMSLAFNSIMHIKNNVNFGWLMRNIHSNGASIFFVCMYLHIGRSIYYGSYKLLMTWTMGMMMLLLTMATAFLGYVLPWGQMSLWGATVITNLLSAVPYLGTDLVNWIWGGFSVENATLKRFFSLHFLFPFLLMGMVFIHLMFLHETGSSNPLGLSFNEDKIPFHPYFSTKDLMGLSFLLILFVSLSLLEPQLLGDPENFIPANALVTPIHIQPEWYFLFAYAILRSIPNKLGGVLAMLTSILIVFTLCFNNNKFQGIKWYPMNQLLFWFLLSLLILLTWIGAKPVEEPYITMSKMFTFLYFLYFMLVSLMFMMWDYILE